MNYWQHIYEHFDPVAFHLGSIAVHWYGIMYALALLTAIIAAKMLIKYDKLDIDQDKFDDYIWWAEIGVILGARLGYILFYDSHTIYYLTHPWQIFNPFIDGVYAGISGMSFHGAFLGFIIATFLFCKKHKISFWFIADIAAIAVPVGYIFGRIGNFLNQELVGRATDVSWGIYVYGTLRHPSQLYEALLEGILIFIIIFVIRKRKRFMGELGFLYAIFYSIARIIAEFFREPDIQLGFIYGGWLTQGMLLSGAFLAGVLALYVYMYKSGKFVRY
jgi:phosphatidylglycerol:prolipoprotein diacylglycerol transferase